MVFNPNDALQALTIACLASVVLCSGLCWTLPKPKKA